MKLVSFKKGHRAFTLIELLVVIAIIGILSSVVLASLNTARNKGADAAVKSNLANARAEAELFYDSQPTTTYVGVCAATGSNVIGDNVQSALNAGGDSGILAQRCSSNATAWAAWSGLKTAATGNDAYCVDSTGAAKELATAPSGAITVCP